MDRKPMNTRILPIFLTLACLILGGAGIYRAGDLILKWDWALEYAASHVDNLPLFLHVIFAVTFILLGAFQLLPSVRARHPRYHRKAGRITALAGIGAALSGVWMTLSYPDISGPILFYGRLIFGSLWAVFILLAVRAILMRQIIRHRAFMIRAYAIAINAGTIPFFYLPFVIIWGEPAPMVDDLFQLGGWFLNLAVAEWIIRRNPRGRAAPALKPQIA